MTPIRTASDGNPAVLSPLSPLAVPLLLNPRCGTAAHLGRSRSVGGPRQTLPVRISCDKASEATVGQVPGPRPERVPELDAHEGRVGPVLHPLCRSQARAVGKRAEQLGSAGRLRSRARPVCNHGAAHRPSLARAGAGPQPRIATEPCQAVTSIAAAGRNGGTHPCGQSGRRCTLYEQAKSIREGRRVSGAARGGSIRIRRPDNRGRSGAQTDAPVQQMPGTDLQAVHPARGTDTLQKGLANVANQRGSARAAEERQDYDRYA